MRGPCAPRRAFSSVASAFRRQPLNAVYNHHHKQIPVFVQNLSYIVAAMGKKGDKRQYYAVVRGRTPGVYRTWEECERQVRGFKGNMYKGFSEEVEAKAFIVKNLGGCAQMETTAGGEHPQPSKEVTVHEVVHGSNQSALRPALRGDSVVRIEFDGAAKGNPGPAAFGVAFYDEASGKQIGQLHRYIGHSGTNNQAEYAGLVAGMHAALEAGYRRCLAQGDSTLIINQVLGYWKVRNENLIPFHAAASLLARRFESFTARQVPRKLNAMADSLANLAIDEWNASQNQNQNHIWTLDTIHLGSEREVDEEASSKRDHTMTAGGKKVPPAHVTGQKRPLSEDADDCDCV